MTQENKIQTDIAKADLKSKNTDKLTVKKEELNISTQEKINNA